MTHLHLGFPGHCGRPDDGGGAGDAVVDDNGATLRLQLTVWEQLL